MTARHADTKEEATHRYIAHDIVAGSDDDAFLFAKASSGTVAISDDVKAYPSNAAVFK